MGVPASTARGQAREYHLPSVTCAGRDLAGTMAAVAHGDHDHDHDHHHHTNDYNYLFSQCGTVRCHGFANQFQLPYRALRTWSQIQR